MQIAIELPNDFIGKGNMQDNSVLTKAELLEEIAQDALKWSVNVKLEQGLLLK